MTHYALFYNGLEDYLSRRPTFREEHLAYAGEAHNRGKLILAGAFDPPDGALLIFRGEDKSIAAEFARNDPYVINGLVSDWTIGP